MLRYVFEWQGWMADPNAFSPRKLSKPKKKALNLVAWFWVKKFLPKHFTRNAYRIYPNAYFTRKKSGAPMVVSGHLRKHILSHVKVTGTSKSATVHMPFGRPAQVSPEALRKKTRIIMLKEKITWREAENKAYANAGYSANAKRQFEIMLRALHPSEERRMAEMFRDFMAGAIEEMARNSRGKRKRIGSVMAKAA